MVALLERKRLTKARLEEMRAHSARARPNAQRTRELAEKAQARLDAERSQG